MTHLTPNDLVASLTGDNETLGLTAADEQAIEAICTACDDCESALQALLGIVISNYPELMYDHEDCSENSRAQQQLLVLAQQLLVDLHDAAAND